MSLAFVFVSVTEAVQLFYMGTVFRANLGQLNQHVTGVILLMISAMILIGMYCIMHL